jgi:hypothetical protein
MKVLTFYMTPQDRPAQYHQAKVDNSAVQNVVALFVSNGWKVESILER